MHGTEQCSFRFHPCCQGSPVSAVETGLSPGRSHLVDLLWRQVKRPQLGVNRVIVGSFPKSSETSSVLFRTFTRNVGSFSNAPLIIRPVADLTDQKRPAAHGAYEALNAEAGMRKRGILTVTLLISSFGTSLAEEAAWDNAIKSGDEFLPSSFYSQAEESYQAAVRKAEEFGDKDRRRARSLNGLAAVYKEQGRYTEAMPVYQRALTIWETTVGPEHPDFATGISNLAILYVSLALRSGATAHPASLNNHEESPWARTSQCGQGLEQPGRVVSQTGSVPRIFGAIEG